MKIHANILEAIGQTPLVRLNRVSAGLDCELIAKCEFFNPGGSVKDRIGVSLIEDAEARGLLKPGGTIVEGTSGNTGVGLAIAAAIKGYKCVFVLPDKMSQEKIRNLRAFGAKVVVTPTAVAPDDPQSYYMVSRRIAQETPNAFYMNQYDNLANRLAHYRSTGPELYEQTDGGQFDAFIAGVGTGGTITGTAMYLKEKNPNIRVIGVDPIGSILHEYFKTGKMGEAHGYKIEGIGEDIIPKNIDFSKMDDMIQVDDKESHQMTRRLLLEEGLFVGVSAGAAVCGAIKWAKQHKGRKRIIVLLPDSGNRYLSKVYDDDWMRENGFLDTGLGCVRDLLSLVKPPMNEALATAGLDDQVQSIVQKMSQLGISQIPILKNGKVAGIVSETAVLNALYSGQIKKSDRVEKVLEKSFQVLAMDEDVDQVSRALAKGLTPLVVEHEKLVAIISKIDFISYLGARNP